MPKPGDRFIHARFLADDAKPPYDTDDKYRVHVVTAVRHWRHPAPGFTVIYHTDAKSYDAGNRKGAWSFHSTAMTDHVRKWLP